MLRILIENSTKEHHPLNAMFLHRILLNKKLAKRDALWTRIKGLTKEEYIKEESLERERVLSIEDFETRFFEYRNLPNEKAADEIAFKYMLEALEDINNSTNNV